MATPNNMIDTSTLSPIEKAMIKVAKEMDSSDKEPVTIEKAIESIDCEIAEPSHGQTLSSDFLKKVTGNDTVFVRKMALDEFLKPSASVTDNNYSDSCDTDDSYLNDDYSDDGYSDEESQTVVSKVKVEPPVDIEHGKKSWHFVDESDDSSDRLKELTIDTNGISMQNISQYTRGATNKLQQCEICATFHVAPMLMNSVYGMTCYHCLYFLNYDYDSRMDIINKYNLNIENYIKLCLFDHNENTCCRPSTCMLCDRIGEKYDLIEKQEKIEEDRPDFIIEI